MTQSAARRAAFRFGAIVPMCATWIFVGLTALWLIAPEDVYSHRGTFAFWVTIREPVIREFPLTAVISGPEYHYGSGDGNRMPGQSVSYVTSLTPEVSFTRASRHIEAHGFTRRSAEPPLQAVFAHGRKRVNQ